MSARRGLLVLAMGCAAVASGLVLWAYVAGGSVTGAGALPMVHIAEDGPVDSVPAPASPEAGGDAGSGDSGPLDRSVATAPSTSRADTRVVVYSTARTERVRSAVGPESGGDAHPGDVDEPGETSHGAASPTTGTTSAGDRGTGSGGTAGVRSGGTGSTGTRHGGGVSH